MGVRISWLIDARKRDFARLADCACIARFAQLGRTAPFVRHIAANAHDIAATGERDEAMLFPETPSAAHAAVSSCSATPSARHCRRVAEIQSPGPLGGNGALK